MSDDQPPDEAGGSPELGADLARSALRRAKAQARVRGLATAGGAGSARPRRAPPVRERDARDPQPFGAAIRELLTDRGWEQTERVAAVMGRWAQIVGADIAAHCRPASLHEGELAVVAESTAWATQLRLLQADLLARISTDLGPGIVTRLHVHGPTAPDWRKGPRRVVGRGPRDTYG